MLIARVAHLRPNAQNASTVFMKASSRVWHAKMSAEHVRTVHHAWIVNKQDFTTIQRKKPVHNAKLRIVWLALPILHACFATHQPIPF